MIKKVIELDVNTKGAVKNVDNLNKSIKETGEVGQDTMSGLSTATGGLTSKFSGLTSGLKSTVKSFKNIRVAIAASGIGLLVLAVVSLKQAFTRSEEGQNKFREIMAVIGVVTGKLLDLLADLGTSLMEVFENPKEALANFWKALKENVVNRIEGFMELLPALGKAIDQVFSGDFSGAAETAANAVGKVTLGVEDIVGKTKAAGEAFKEFANEVVESTGKILVVTRKRNEADRLNRKLTVERAKADRKIAAFREKAADREKYTATQRIAFLHEAGKISEDITNKEIQKAQLLYEAKELENAQTKSTKEDKQELADLEAAMINLETQRISKQKALTAAVQTALAEEKALKDAAAKEEKDRLDADVKAKEDAEAAKLKATELAAKKDSDLKDKNAKKQEEIDAIILAQKEQMAAQGINIVAEVLGKESALYKGLAIAQTTWETYKGATSAYAAGSAMGPAGVVMGPLAAGLAITSGLLSVQKILSVKTPSVSGVGGGGGGSISAPSIPIPSPPDAPEFGQIGNNGSNAIADMLGDNNSKPV